MRQLLLILAFLAGAIPCRAASDIYFAQAAAGGATGANCANAISLATLNGTAGDWVGDNTLHLCGTITGTVVAAGSGTSGHVITILFETGGNITEAACGTTGCINLNSKSYIKVNGGTTCGWVAQISTACNGTIACTNVGTGLSNTDCVAIYARGGGTGIEIENLLMANMYVHTSPSDTSASGNYYCIWSDVTSPNFHNNICHDAMAYVKGESGINNGTADANSEAYNDRWDVFLSGPSTNTSCAITTLTIHDFNYHDWENWDTTTDTYHLDGVIIAGNNNLANGVCAIKVYNGYLHGSMTKAANCPSNCMTAMIFFNDGNGVQVFNNVMIANAGELTFNGLLFFWSPVALNSNDLIANNTIICQSAGGSYCLTIEGDASLTYQNNIVSMVGGTSVAWIRVYHPPNVTFTANSNNIYQAPSLTQMWEGPPNGTTFYSTLASWQGALGGSNEANSLAQTGTLNLSSGNFYRQNSGSVVIGAGANLSSLSITALDSDFAGNARPGGVTAWDIGAWFGPVSASGTMGGFGGVGGFGGNGGL